MALVVEDGSGKTDADSFVSITDASTHIGARYGATAKGTWDALADDVAEGYLREATAYMEAFYGQRLIGQLLTEAQALCFPRIYMTTGAYEGTYLPSNVVPWQWVRACAWLAYKASQGPLQPDLAATTGAGLLIEDSVTVGPIEVTQRFTGSGTLAAGDRFPEITSSLRRFLTAGSINVAVERA